jgi:GxxExxY protein
MIISNKELTGKIIGCAIEVHRNLGPGLLESIYRDSLLLELCDQGIQVKKEISIPVVYKNRILSTAYRIDLLVENSIIIELKAVEKLNEIHFAQTLTYLKITKCKLALLINFNVLILKDGIRRIIN